MPRKRGNGEGSINQLADGRWQGRIMVGYDPITGKPNRKAVYGKTQKEVREKLSALREELKNGLKVTVKKMTFGEWLDKWLEDHIKIGTRLTTYENYSCIVKTHIRPLLGTIRLDKLKTEEIQELLRLKLNGDKAGMGKLSSKTVILIHMIINSAIKQAMRSGILTCNVAERVTLPKKVRKEIHPMSKGQIHQFLAAIANDRMFAAYYLLLATGMRRGELLGLKWSDIDFNNKCLRINRALAKTNTCGAQFSDTKTQRSRRMIPLESEAIQILKRYKQRQTGEKGDLGEAYQDQDMVFCRGDGVPMHPDVFTHRFIKLTKKAGMIGFRVHDLRHTFATIALGDGIHPKIVQEILGHSNINTTLDIYSHVLPGLKEQAMDRMGSILNSNTHNEGEQARKNEAISANKPNGASVREAVALYRIV